MRKSSKLLVAATAAGLIATAGSAFTGTGISTTGTAAADQFVGGQVSQSVTGATLSTIAYDFTDETNTLVDGITLTFTDSNATASRLPYRALTQTGGRLIVAW